jgi:hypothetical protein
MPARFKSSTRARRCPPLALAIAAASFAVPEVTNAADAAHPTVVEIFQSQGCSSCPPANENVLALADRPDILALSWQVTYWDDLGWKDTFAKAAYTDRQWEYAHAFGRHEVATPEVVVNGRNDVSGIYRKELDALIQKFDRGPVQPTIVLDAHRVSINGAGAKATVLLVRFDPGIVNVPIAAGENHGRTLPHRNVVREVAVLGTWDGGAAGFDLPASAPGLKSAVLLQQGPGGPILAAARER